MSETVDTTKVGNSASLAPTAPSTVPAENTNPATDGPASPPATVAAPGAGQRGRTASAHHRDRVGTSTAAASRAAGRPRVAGTVTPAEAAAAAKAPEGGDVAGDRDAAPVPEQVWAVLLTRPGSTAAELAATADVGRSTVSKLLATWASEGTATSIPGATARAARRWTATPDDTTTDTTTGAAPRQAEGVGAVDANAARSATETTSQACGQASQLAGTDTVDDAPSSLQPTDSATRGTRRGPVADAAVDRTSPGSPAGVANAGAATGPAEARPRVPRSHHRGPSRLAAGQLRGMVEEYLAEHPGPHGPVAIGHALGHSSGAIANALERLVETGWAERSGERPKRYQFADSDSDSDSTPTPTPTPTPTTRPAMTQLRTPTSLATPTRTTPTRTALLRRIPSRRAMLRTARSTWRPRR